MAVGWALDTTPVSGIWLGAKVVVTTTVKDMGTVLVHTPIMVLGLCTEIPLLPEEGEMETVTGLGSTMVVGMDVGMRQ